MDDQKFHDFLDRFVRDLGPAIAAGGASPRLLPIGPWPSGRSRPSYPR